MSTQHTLLKGHTSVPPASRKGLLPRWSPTQAWKPKCPQRQTSLSLGPSVLVPTVASLEKRQHPADGAALQPLPLSLQAMAPLWGSGAALREGAELQQQDSHRGSHAVTCQASAPGTTGKVLLCWKDGSSTGRATPGTCAQQSQELGMEQGREKVFQFCY